MNLVFLGGNCRSFRVMSNSSKDSPLLIMSLRGDFNIGCLLTSYKSLELEEWRVSLLGGCQNED